MSTQSETKIPTTSVEVRERLVESLRLDLVGPWAGHALAEEQLPGRVRPSNWYLTGFLIPSGTPPEQSADVDEDEELGEVPESAGLAEESAEEGRAAKKGFFPSSIGLSFLVSAAIRGLSNRFSVIFFRACREELLHLFFPAGQVQVLPAG